MINFYSIFRASLLLLSILLSACKPSKIYLSDEGKVDLTVSKRQLIKAHKKTNGNFKTLQAKVKIDIKSGESESGYSISLRMEKDQMIWLTAPLGLVRAKITNEQVQFYNKIDKTYYEGDYAFFSKYLGIEVNYDMLQALILANFMKETNPSNMELSFTNKAYSLKSQNTTFFELIYLLDPSHFKLSQQKILDHFNNRTLSVSYASFQKINSSVIPEKISIDAKENTKRTQVKIEVKSVQLDQELRYPYTVPEGFKLLALNE